MGEPERLAFQIHRAHRELDGPPWDTPLDTSAVFAEAATLRRIFETRAAGA